MTHIEKAIHLVPTQAVYNLNCFNLYSSSIPTEFPQFHRLIWSSGVC